jgi:L-rhamnose mutarotase
MEDFVRRYCLTLDLKDDANAIAEYKRYHEKIRPEIKASIVETGVTAMEIYVLGTRMFLLMEVDEGFSFEAKKAADLSNPKVQEWENLMRRFQQQLPGARADQWWTLMEKIFSLEEQ